MKSLLILSFSLFVCPQAFCQKQVDFYGHEIQNDICNQLPFRDNEEAKTCLNNICSAGGVINNFTMIPCIDIGNCLAIYRNHIQYILYDNHFLKRLSAFGFTEKNLPSAGTNWPEIAIMAHEIGHHVMGHFTNPFMQQNFTVVQLELQADEYAGNILYKLGATLAEAQQVMLNDDITIQGSDTHPPRQQRIEAIAKGYQKARNSDNIEVMAISADKIIQGLTLHGKWDRSDQMAFNNGTQYAYHYYLTGDDAYLDEIKEVRYVRNHATFYEVQNNTYQSSQDRASGFDYKGYQWGYINTVYVTVVLKDGTISPKTLVNLTFD
jgi:hypothetical protein